MTAAAISHNNSNGNFWLAKFCAVGVVLLISIAVRAASWVMLRLNHWALVLWADVRSSSSSSWVMVGMGVPFDATTTPDGHATIIRGSSGSLVRSDSCYLAMSTLGSAGASTLGFSSSE